jgi:uncharacterized protein (TIGR02246 family)
MSRFRWVIVLPLLVATLSASGCAGRAEADRAEIQAVVKAYFAAMTRSDPTAIMETFTRDPKVSSVYDGVILRGWEAIREDTDKVVGGEEKEEWAPGTLDVVRLEANHALVVVPVVVTLRSQEGVEQYQAASTFVLVKADGAWKILHEHHSFQDSDGGPDSDTGPTRASRQVPVKRRR